MGWKLVFDYSFRGPICLSIRRCLTTHATPLQKSEPLCHRLTLFQNEINLPHTSAALFFKLPKSRIWQVVTTIEELDLLKIMMRKRGNQIGAKDNAKRYNHRYHNGVYNHHQEHTHIQLWIFRLTLRKTSFRQKDKLKPVNNVRLIYCWGLLVCVSAILVIEKLRIKCVWEHSLSEVAIMLSSQSYTFLNLMLTYLHRMVRYKS